MYLLTGRTKLVRIIEWLRLGCFLLNKLLSDIFIFMFQTTIPEFNLFSDSAFLTWIFCLVSFDSFGVLFCFILSQEFPFSDKSFVLISGLYILECGFIYTYFFYFFSVGVLSNISMEYQTTRIMAATAPVLWKNLRNPINNIPLSPIFAFPQESSRSFWVSF